MNFKITFASQDESFPLELGEVTARIVPADPDLQDKTVTPTESTQTVTCDPDHDGLGTVTVNPIPPEYVIPDLQDKTVTPMETAQTVTADAGKTGLSSVTVNRIPEEYVIPTGTVTLSSNGQHDVSGKAVAAVDVQPVLQSKSVTPTRAAQTVTPDSGKDGLSAVEVGGIPSEYVIPEGSKSITENGTHDVTDYASAVVNVPGPSGQIEITENGTVDVAEFASALVNVSGGGGASNVVTGEFTATSDGIFTIDVPYTGNGYPIALFVFPSEGGYDPSGAFYKARQKSATWHLAIVKTIFNAPTYTGSGTNNTGYILVTYKSSTTDGSATASQKGSISAYGQTPAQTAATYTLRIASATAIKVYARTTENKYGFMTGTPYTYIVLYSE